VTVTGVGRVSGGYVTGIWKRLTMRAREEKQDRPNRNETKSGEVKLNHQ